jgi:hypothetical protein
VAALGGLKKFKMAAVAIGTKVQKMLNSLQTSQSFAVMFPYQVSSISAWRETCYDHFCVLNFFSILAIFMATVAILKKSTLSRTTSHRI